MATEALERFQGECREHFLRLWHEKPQPLVFGDGKVDAPTLMLIGEAPGEQEALQGKPFVGKAGKNLTEFLLAVGLLRSELYISNVVKMRPSKTSAAGRIVNRPPTQEEIAQFAPWLYREIAIVKPKAIVTLGNVALHAFVEKEETIGNCHGRWRDVSIKTSDSTFQLPLFALYHPASVIYNRALATVYADDLRTLKGSLARGGSYIDN